MSTSPKECCLRPLQLTTTTSPSSKLKNTRVVQKGWQAKQRGTLKYSTERARCKGRYGRRQCRVCSAGRKKTALDRKTRRCSGRTPFAALRALSYLARPPSCKAPLKRASGQHNSPRRGHYRKRRYFLYSLLLRAPCCGGFTSYRRSRAAALFTIIPQNE